jgi:hypothetical protein
MYSYLDQLKVVEKVRIRDGQTVRSNCPFCGGRNTFTITRKGNEYVWNCYKASCGVTGGKGDDDLSGIRIRSVRGDDPRGLSVPFLTSVETQASALKWLDSVHSTQAYREGLIDIKYAPSEDRIMFPVAKGLGYVGRGRKGVYPKWRKYGDCTSLLTVGRGSTAVVVEDAPSACAVGVLPSMTGCALLGTILSRQHIIELRAFDRVLVCLDPDATGKAHDMVSKLQGTVKTVFCPIPDDLKNYGPETISEILK